MLDIPSVGRDILNRTMRRVAEVVEDSLIYEDTIEILENCKALVGPTELRARLGELALTHEEQIGRERDVVRSFMEVQQVKGLM